jgi:hypothetical protein
VRWLAYFRASGLAFLVLSVVLTVLGIANRVAYRFGGRGDPDRILSDVLLKGTGLSAPIVFVIVFALLLALTWLPRPWRGIPLALVAIFGVVGLIAGIGEIDGGLPRAGLSPLVSAIWLLALAVVVAVVVTAIASAIDAVKRRRVPESH